MNTDLYWRFFGALPCQLSLWVIAADGRPHLMSVAGR